MGFDCRISTGLGETETQLLEGTHKVVYASGPRGKKQETEPEQPASVVGSPAEAGDGCGSPQGRNTGNRGSGGAPWREPSPSLPMAPPGSL